MNEILKLKNKLNKLNHKKDLSKDEYSERRFIEKRIAELEREKKYA